MKFCPKCKETKSLECFNKNKARHDGLAPHCKECRTKYQKTQDFKEKRKIYNFKNKERISQLRKEWYLENREKRLVKSLNDYCKHKQKRKNRTLKIKYGIDLKDYESMLLSQDGKCKICKKAKPGKYNFFAVDHDHLTGKVRGLLCSKCNIGLGQFEDNEDLLIEASKYLAESRKVL